MTSTRWKNASLDGKKRRLIRKRRKRPAADEQPASGPTGHSLELARENEAFRRRLAEEWSVSEAEMLRLIKVHFTTKVRHPRAPRSRPVRRSGNGASNVFETGGRPIDANGRFNK